MKINKNIIILSIILVVLATACKYFFGANPTLSGFSPIIAIALFAGFMVKRKDLSFLLPLAALLVSDVIIQGLYVGGRFEYAGFYPGQWKNYLILLTAVLIGWQLKGKKLSGILTGALAAPILFFLASNTMVWMSTTEVVYAKSFAGWMTCVEAGLPFFRNSLIATMVFLPLILLAYNYLTRKKMLLTIA